MISDMRPGLDLYYTGPAQHVMTAGEGLDDRLTDRDLPDFVRRGTMLKYVNSDTYDACAGSALGLLYY